MENMENYELYLNYYEWGNLKLKLEEGNIKYTIDSQDTEGIDIIMTTTPSKARKVFDYIKWLYV